MSAALLLASTAASTATAPTPAHIAVPSGAEVWLQEGITDRVPGVGLVQRYRFVMPSLAALVPPSGADDGLTDLPPDMVDEGPGAGDQPLTPAEQAELDAAIGDLVISEVPPEGEGVGKAPPLPGDGGEIDGPLPSELAAPDPTIADGAAPDAEEGGDLAAAAQTDPLAPALPEAPDILMQDPVHEDIVWLCEHYALPRLSKASPRPAQVVISIASAPTPFGSFDPQVVQLFEGFSIPPDREVCIWEPI